MGQPIRIHPENPKLFLFRGQPVVLLTPTEHYGAVMNRPFRYERYLDDAQAKRINFTRLFLLFRELQNPVNPHSTCKPDSPDYVAPFKRVPPTSALDGQFKYDLDQWNPEFFARLHGFVALAEQSGVIVEVVLFSNTYATEIWNLNPLNAANNLNDLETIPWYEYTTARHPKLSERQRGYVRRIVRELNAYDNVVFEICNEPGGNLDTEGAPTSDEVDAWLDAMIALVREEESSLPNRHLIFGQEAFAYRLPGQENRLDVFQFADKAFRAMDYDAVTVHPLSNMRYAGRHYHLGRFMQAELHLEAFRDYTLELYFNETKPVVHDEDNCASQFKDVLGWTIHRKRAWTAAFGGAHYDYIDFSINNYAETGTDESNRAIRSWFKHLSEYMHSLDLVRGRPLRRAVIECPASCVESAFGIPGGQYAVYLADARERFAENYGNPVQGDLVIRLEPGQYSVDCLNPTTGGWSPSIVVIGSEKTRLTLPRFDHDLVARFRRK